MRTGTGTPYCVADAFMFSDDKNIVQITDMTVRLTGIADRAEVGGPLVRAISAPKFRVFIRPSSRALYGPDKIIAYAQRQAVGGLRRKI